MIGKTRTSSTEKPRKHNKMGAFCRGTQWSIPVKVYSRRFPSWLANFQEYNRHILFLDSPSGKFSWIKNSIIMCCIQICAAFMLKIVVGDTLYIFWCIKSTICHNVFFSPNVYSRWQLQNYKLAAFFMKSRLEDWE